ncbi:hypothetical protein BY458DRAFT_24348 [Sporodiniella umbellata]|nr:hypothetical protein BY458DRAFT_24348 [Sporodiniella umbellata]
MLTMTLHSDTAVPSINGTKGKKPYKSWLKDGVNGGPSSMEVLVNWLSKKANYAKWKGNDHERIPKKSLLESIIDEMRKVGIYHRLAKDVASKISTLQANYRLARGWKEIEGKKWMGAGATEEVIYEELLKRFPYWTLLDKVFCTSKSAAWPMSIRNITHTELKKDRWLSAAPEALGKRRRLSDSLVDSTHTLALLRTSPTHSLPTPLPRVSLDPRQDTLTDALFRVTREKVSGRMRRSHDMLHFLNEKRHERDQLLVEREITKRVRAKAELVKNLLHAGFTKDAIAEQLNRL